MRSMENCCAISHRRPGIDLTSYCVCAADVYSRLYRYIAAPPPIPPPASALPTKRNRTDATPPSSSFKRWVMRPFLLSAGMGLFFHFFLSSDNNNNNTTNTLPISPRIQSTLSARSCFDSPRQKKKSYYGHSRRRNKRYYSAQNKWSLQLFPSRKKYKKKTCENFLEKERRRR